MTDNEGTKSIVEDPESHLSSEAGITAFTHHKSGEGFFCDVCASMVWQFRNNTGAAQLQKFTTGNYGATPAEIIPIRPSTVVQVSGLNKNIWLCQNHVRELLSRFVTGNAVAVG